ncbi:titin-like [Planococcus citri]|uniref:titin-like n=1 Tax=Planococcus citri TaxID=170843 RepID=UPI0031FA34FD
MCDQTEVPYLAGNIVWVKLGPVWWPGKVCSEEEIPPEVLKELRKKPIAIVKFFQEESFEYVKKLSNIYHYNCLKKDEFIKKGLDMCRSNNRDTPSNMKLFPEDITTAEILTGGDPNIIHDEKFLPEKKPSYAADFAPTPKKTPKKMKIERKKETPTPKPATPRVITHPRFIRHGVCDYEARERKQVPLRAECDEEDTSPPTTYRCPDCDFTTIRLNVIVLHNKSHVRNYASQHTSVKGIKRKSTSTIRHKEKRPAIERKSTDIAKPKTPKVQTSEKPKTPQKKSPVSLTQPKESSAATPPKSVEVHKPISKKRKQPQANTDEFQNSLLEDWAEFENEQEVNDDSTVSEELNESTASSSSKTGKSCFDFDDSEDGLVIDRSKIRAGRKIPRVLEDKDEDSNAFSEPSTSMDDQISPSDGNRNGIDSNDDQEYEETRKTSQLQEMGVDNEIEIDSEDVNDTKDENDEIDQATIDIPLPPEPDQKDPEKERAAEELKQKVDKLLEEISTPSKLPDVPYSVKKAHIKSFNESEELARREAEKLQAAEAAKTEPVQDSKPPKPEPQIVPETKPEPVQIYETEIADIPLPENSQPESKLSQLQLTQQINELTPEPAIIEEVAQTVTNSDAKVAATPTPALAPAPAAPVVLAKSTVAQEPAHVNAEQNAKPIKIVVGSSNQIVLSAASATNATPVKTISTGQVKLVTTPKFKIINQTDLSKAVGSPTKVLAATTATSVDGKAGPQPIINKLQSVDGKTILSLSPQKFIINKNKSMIIDAKQLLNCQTTSGQKIRFLGPNILQKTAAVRAQVTAAVTGVKTPTKSITLPSNLTGGNVVVIQPKKSIVLAGTAASTESASSMINSTSSAAPNTATEVTYIADDATGVSKNYQVVNTVPVASSANSTAQIVTVDLNQTNNLYITDQSGNLIISDGSANNPPPPKEDILAKALENTDVLQSDIALSDVSQSVLDTISVAQNTPLTTFKTDAIYDTNLTLNTPPIMSSFETPSRALNPAAVLAEAVSNEMIILNDNNEFVT